MGVLDQSIGERKQSAEHIEKRKRFGPEHYAWQGDDISEKGGRHRALRMYKSALCEECAADNAERHHVDGNTANNVPNNIRMLCRRCHMIVDGRLDNFAEIARARIDQTIEAAAVAKRSRTHCKRGHELTDPNVYINPKGARVCKLCRSADKKRYRARGGKG